MNIKKGKNTNTSNSLKSRNNALTKNESGLQQKNQDIYDPDQTLNGVFSGGRTPTGQAQATVTPTESQKDQKTEPVLHEMKD